MMKAKEFHQKTDNIMKSNGEKKDRTLHIDYLINQLERNEVTAIDLDLYMLVPDFSKTNQLKSEKLSPEINISDKQIPACYSKFKMKTIVYRDNNLVLDKKKDDNSIVLPRGFIAKKNEDTGTQIINLLTGKTIINSTYKYRYPCFSLLDGLLVEIENFGLLNIIVYNYENDKLIEFYENGVLRNDFQLMRLPDDRIIIFVPHSSRADNRRAGIYVWDVKAKENPYYLTSTENFELSLVLPNNRLVIYSDHSTIEVWDIRAENCNYDQHYRRVSISEKCIKKFNIFGNSYTSISARKEITCIDVSPDGYLLVGFTNGEVQFWDIDSGEHKYTLPSGKITKHGIASLTIIPNGLIIKSYHCSKYNSHTIHNEFYLCKIPSLMIKNEDINRINKLLITNQFIVNNKNTDGKTTLMMAAKNGNTKLIEELLKCGAKTYLVDTYYRDALNIAFAYRQWGSVETLIRNRQAISEEYFTEVYSQCKDKYKGNFEDRAQDHHTLVEAVSILTKVDINKAKELQIRLFGHLKIWKGVITDLYNRADKKEMEGFFREEIDKVLALRVFAQMELLLKTDKGLISDREYPKDISKQVIVNKLKQEIFVNLELIHSYQCLVTIVKAPNKEIIQKLAQAHARNIAEKIEVLADNQEYSCYTGFIGHAIYANFTRYNDDIVARIDNLGSGYYAMGHKIEMKYSNRRQKENPRVYPFCLGSTPIQDFSKKEANLLYLNGMICAFNKSKEEALPLIYNSSAFRPHAFPNTWSPKTHQLGGHCVIANHTVGIRLRLNKEQNHNQFFKWYKKTEKVIVESLDEVVFNSDKNKLN